MLAIVPVPTFRSFVPLPICPSVQCSYWVFHPTSFSFLPCRADSVTVCWPLGTEEICASALVCRPVQSVKGWKTDIMSLREWVEWWTEGMWQHWVGATSVASEMMSERHFYSTVIPRIDFWYTMNFHFLSLPLWLTLFSLTFHFHCLPSLVLSLCVFH